MNSEELPAESSFADCTNQKIFCLCTMYLSLCTITLPCMNNCKHQQLWCVMSRHVRYIYGFS